MLSQTGTYALQAVIWLATQPENTRTPARILAEELEIPGNYLAKVLQRLAREEILESTRGARGGFTLARSADELTVADVVAPFQELQKPRVCLMGGACDLENPCTAHSRRTAWNAVVMEMLRTTTVADLLTAPEPRTNRKILPFLPEQEIA